MRSQEWRINITDGRAACEELGPEAPGAQRGKAYAKEARGVSGGLPDSLPTSGLARNGGARKAKTHDYYHPASL